MARAAVLVLAAVVAVAVAAHAAQAQTVWAVQRHCTTFFCSHADVNLVQFEAHQPAAAKAVATLLPNTASKDLKGYDYFGDSSPSKKTYFALLVDTTAAPIKMMLYNVSIPGGKFTSAPLELGSSIPSVQDMVAIDDNTIAIMYTNTLFVIDAAARSIKAKYTLYTNPSYAYNDAMRYDAASGTVFAYIIDSSSTTYMIATLSLGTGKVQMSPPTSYDGGSSSGTNVIAMLPAGNATSLAMIRDSLLGASVGYFDTTTANFDEVWSSVELFDLGIGACENCGVYTAADTTLCAAVDQSSSSASAAANDDEFVFACFNLSSKQYTTSPFGSNSEGFTFGFALAS